MIGSLILMAALAAPATDGITGTAAAVMHPLVRVRTGNGSGSGVVLYSADREGTDEYRTFILTNHHVIASAVHVVKKWDSLKQRWYDTEDNDRVTVEVFRYLRGGRTVLGQPIPAIIRAHKAEEDMALLELDYPLPVEHVATLLPQTEKLQLLAQVYAVGCSLGEDPMVTIGHITDLEELIENKPYIMASAQIIYGNSGGAVFTRAGGKFYFVGVPSRIRVTRQGQAMTHMGFFIPPARVRKFFKRQKLDFLLDKNVTPTESFAARLKLRNPRRKTDEMGPPAPR